jgi:glycine oxidase
MQTFWQMEMILQMKKVYDVIIIGGGVIGSSIAYSQAKCGKKVLVLEKNRLISEASSAAAGMLGAQAEIDEHISMLKLALKSRAMFPSLIRELEECTGVDIGLVNKGMIKVAETEGEVVNLKKQISFHRDWDQAVKWLTIEELLEKEALLSPSLLGGMYIPNDGQLIAPRLSLSFAKAAMKYGTDFLEYSEVVDFLIENDCMQGVVTATDTFHTDNVVVTTGAWTSQLLAKANIEMDVYPVKGECFSVIPRVPLISSTVFSELGCYIVPKKDGRVIVGATSYCNTFDKTVSLQGLSQLMERAGFLLPEIGSAKWEKSWAGIRPQTGDGLPYIGAHPNYKGLYIAAGHYRNGILLSPITGKMVSDMINDAVTEEDRSLYHTFRVDRQSSPKQTT